MKHNYISAKKLSLWMRLVKRWNRLFGKLKVTFNIQSFKKLNNLSQFLGINKKIVLAVSSGLIAFGGIQAQTFNLGGSITQPIDFLDTGYSTAPAFLDICLLYTSPSPRDA